MERDLTPRRCVYHGQILLYHVGPGRLFDIWTSFKPGTKYIIKVYSLKSGTSAHPGW